MSIKNVKSSVNVKRLFSNNKTLFKIKKLSFIDPLFPVNTRAYLYLNSYFFNTHNTHICQGKNTRYKGVCPNKGHFQGQKHCQYLNAPKL